MVCLRQGFLEHSTQSIDSSSSLTFATISSQVALNFSSKSSRSLPSKLQVFSLGTLSSYIYNSEYFNCVIENSIYSLSFIGKREKSIFKNAKLDIIWRETLCIIQKFSLCSILVYILHLQAFNRKILLLSFQFQI